MDRPEYAERYLERVEESVGRISRLAARLQLRIALEEGKASTEEQHDGALLGDGRNLRVMQRAHGGLIEAMYVIERLREELEEAWGMPPRIVV